MEAIRLEAGVSKPTLYTYFVSKEDLFLAIVHQVMDEFGDVWQPALRGELSLRTQAELQATLLTLTQSMVSIMLRPDYVNLIRVVISETPSFPSLGSLLSSSMPTRGINMIASILEQARQQGMIIIEDTTSAARMLVGPIIIHLLMDGLLISSMPREPDQGHIAALVATYTQAICA